MEKIVVKDWVDRILEVEGSLKALVRLLDYFEKKGVVKKVKFLRKGKDLAIYCKDEKAKQIVLENLKIYEIWRDGE